MFHLTKVGQASQSDKIEITQKTLDKTPINLPFSIDMSVILPSAITQIISEQIVLGF